MTIGKDEAVQTANPGSSSTKQLETTGHHTESLDDCIRQRHSIREYLPDPVDHNILYDCLALAQLAPSNSNIQNWRLFIATGQARDRIVKQLMAEAESHGPNIPALPDKYRHHRSELGHDLYGPDGYGIPRHDKKGHDRAVMRNYEFFGAPVIAVMAQDPALSIVDAMSVGMYLQTFLLALTEQGLGTCVEVSVAGYPDVLQREFGTELHILCGIAIGWPDPKSKVNKVIVGREEVDENVKWLTE